MITRRHFVQTSLLTMAAVGFAPSVWAKKGLKLPVALQLYSIRNDCAKDFDAALAEVSNMGFDGVEFAGYYNYKDKPKELARKLKSLKLKVAATHIPTATLRGDALKETIDFHKTIGCKYLIVPGDKDFTDPEKSKALAETFNDAAATLKKVGMACGYHNHKHEFEKDKETGKTWWDLFAERTSKDVILQQDCGWTAASGYDPVEVMKKWSGRMKSTHFKPTVVNNEPGKKAFLGEDSVNWPAVIDACIKYGGTKWITLEQEVYPDGKTPMEATAISFSALRKLLA